MRRRIYRKLVYFTSEIILFLAVLIMTVIGAINFVELEGDHAPDNETLRMIVSIVHQTGWVYLFWFGLAAGIATIISRLTGRPWVWNAVEAVLDELVKAAIRPEFFKDANHHHRATLFKHKRFKMWIWPWRGWTPWGHFSHPFSGWLAPIARSGYTTQTSNVVFLAPDNADCPSSNKWNRLSVQLM